MRERALDANSNTIKHTDKRIKQIIGCLNKPLVIQQVGFLQS